MADARPTKPPLRKPPGFRDPYATGPRPPPRKPVPLPPSFHPRKKRGSCCRACCCCICTLILIAIILILIAGALVYLWFEPKLPSFHLQSFKFSSFNVTSKPDGTYLDAATLVRVEVHNPNSRLAFRYGESEVEITVGKEKDTQLGTASLPAFEQGRMNTTSLKIEATARDELVEDGVGARLKEQFKSGAMVVNVDVKTSVGLGAGGLRVDMVGVRVLCDGVKLKEIDDDGQMPQCGINIFRWINLN